jgi:hypothetical protein
MIGARFAPRFACGFHCNRDFHFVFRLQANTPPVASALHLLCIHSKAKDLGVPVRAFARTNNHDLPHFEAISQTPLPQLPSVVQIGFAFLPSLPGWQWQSLYLPQYASKQAPRQVALRQQQPVVTGILDQPSARLLSEI